MRSGDDVVGGYHMWLPSVASFSALLVEQATRSHTADDETHAEEDGENRPQDAPEKRRKLGFIIIASSSVTFVLIQTVNLVVAAEFLVAVPTAVLSTILTILVFTVCVHISGTGLSPYSREQDHTRHTHKTGQDM